MARFSTAVQDASQELPSLVHTRSQVVSIGSSSTNAAGADFAIDIMMVENEWINGIQLASGSSSITGASQYDWANIPGAKKARVRRTDATAGIGIVDIEVCEA